MGLNVPLQNVMAGSNFGELHASDPSALAKSGQVNQETLLRLLLPLARRLCVNLRCGICTRWRLAGEEVTLVIHLLCPLRISLLISRSLQHNSKSAYNPSITKSSTITKEVAKMRRGGQMWLKRVLIPFWVIQLLGFLLIVGSGAYSLYYLEEYFADDTYYNDIHTYYGSMR